MKRLLIIALCLLPLNVWGATKLSEIDFEDSTTDSYEYSSNGTGHSDPGGTWGTQSYVWTTNPNTTEAWTVDDVNGTGAAPLQNFGYFAIGVIAGEEVDVTQCYMVVTWE